MNPIRILSLAGLACLATARADLLVYEPFDYAPHNDETFGRADGRNGGKGFAAPWKDSTGPGNDGAAYIYDAKGNPADLYGGTWGGGFPNWDGKVDNL
ncbi:MAG TPA: hypothetical protein VFY13_04570, partial [Luteolibacter sp.]|nr:hypothetical protein [Luteolibacter sp.]